MGESQGESEAGPSIIFGKSFHFAVVDISNVTGYNVKFAPIILSGFLTILLFIV